MANTFWEDCVCDLLETAVSDCAFGKPIVYEPRGQRRRIKLNAVVDGPAELVDPDTEVSISSNELSIGVKLADLRGLKPTKGDRVVIGKDKFRVVDSQEDGQGGAQLFMHRAC
jgi:hypothetical protein